MDFMLIHGNDYFVVPFDFPVSRLARIDEPLVHDVLAASRWWIGPTRRPPRRTLADLFLDLDCGSGWRPADFLLLPPSAGPPGW
jgi:hypothetical protein